MTRSRPLVALGIALALAAFAAPAPLLAQDGGGASLDGGRKERKKSAEELYLEAVGKEFKAKDTSALVERIPEKGKAQLQLGGKDDSYSRTQAKAILDDWFENRSITTCKLKSTKDLVGEFELKFRRKGKDEEVERTLQVTLKRKADDTFVLKALVVQD